MREGKSHTAPLTPPHPLEGFHTKRITTAILQSLKEKRVRLKVLFQVFIFMMKSEYY